MDIEGFRARLGGAIRAHRRAAGMTQEALAEAVETSTEWVSQVERGLGMPSLELLLRMSEAVDVSAVELMRAGLDEGVGRPVAQELAAAIAGLSERDVRVLVAAAQEMGRSRG